MILSIFLDEQAKRDGIICMINEIVLIIFLFLHSEFLNTIKM
jgi:hypothetical protein